MPGRDHVRPSKPGLKLTYEDFVQFPDDGMRHELIDGEHYATPSPRLRHQAIIGNLYVMIASWLDAHPIGRAFLSPVDVVMTDIDIVVPDLLYVSNAREHGEVLTTPLLPGLEMPLARIFRD